MNIIFIYNYINIYINTYIYIYIYYISTMYARTYKRITQEFPKSNCDLLMVSQFLMDCENFRTITLARENFHD